jgi:hypothetical protein
MAYSTVGSISIEVPVSGVVFITGLGVGIVLSVLHVILLDVPYLYLKSQGVYSIHLLLIFVLLFANQK